VGRKGKASYGEMVLLVRGGNMPTANRLSGLQERGNPAKTQLICPETAGSVGMIQKNNIPHKTREAQFLNSPEAIAGREKERGGASSGSKKGA